MQNKFVINDSSKDVLRDKTLLLDTNVLIDAYRLPSEFYELLNELVSLGCDIVTTKTIVVEFLGSTTDDSALKKKIAFLEMLLGKRLHNGYLPIDRDFPSTVDFPTKLVNRISFITLLGEAEIHTYGVYDL